MVTGHWWAGAEHQIALDVCTGGPDNVDGHHCHHHHRRQLCHHHHHLMMVSGDWPLVRGRWAGAEQQIALDGKTDENTIQWWPVVGLIMLMVIIAIITIIVNIITKMKHNDGHWREVGRGRAVDSPRWQNRQKYNT